MIPMEIHRKALKDRARQTMRQNVPPAWLVALLFWGLTTGVSTISDLAGFTTSLAASSSGVQFFPPVLHPAAHLVQRGDELRLWDMVPEGLAER